MQWVKASERLPVKPENYRWSYDDQTEPAIVFINRVHDATFAWFHSLGWDIKDHPSLKDQPGWNLSQWEWLEESKESRTQVNMPESLSKWMENECQELYNAIYPRPTLTLMAEAGKAIYQKMLQSRSLSLPETEQAIDPAEARRNIPYGMDEWCEAHQSYYKYECPECAIPASPDQPVPEDVMEWLNAEIHSELPYYYDDDAVAMKVDAQRAIAKKFALLMYKRDQAIIATLQTHLSSTEAERDAIKQAFDLQAEELRKLRNQ